MTDMDAEWPDDRDRTPAGERKPYPHSFDVTRHKAFESILEELRKMDARNVQVKSDVHHQQRNSNLPYADANYEDPGVVVYYEIDGGQYAMAMDRWSTPRDNARAIALTLKAKRALTRYGVETIESEFQTQALPPADDEVIEAGPVGGRRTGREATREPDREPHEILNVSEDAPAPVVNGAFRELVKNDHPDNGGTGAEVETLKWARNQLLEDADEIEA